MRRSCDVWPVQKRMTLEIISSPTMQRTHSSTQPIWEVIIGRSLDMVAILYFSDPTLVNIEHVKRTQILSGVAKNDHIQNIFSYGS